MKYFTTRAGAVWLAVACAAVLAEMARAPSVHQDFVPLYSAACLAGTGRLDQAYEYDHRVRKRAGEPLTRVAHERGYPVRTISRYLHPPAVAMLVYPFTLLSYPTAAYLFRTLSIAALVAAAVFLASVAGMRTGWTVLLIVLLLFDPERMTLDLGQVNNMVLGLVAFGLAAGNPVASGAALGVAGLFKTFVLGVPALWLVAGTGRKARAAGLTAFTTLASLHACAYLLWPEGTFAWIDMARELAGFQFLWPEQQSAASQVVRVLSGFDTADVVGWVHSTVPLRGAAFFPVVWAAAVGGAAALVALWRRPGDLALASLGLAAGLLASPVLHSHYGLLLVPVAAWFVVRGAWDAPARLYVAGMVLQALPLHSDEGAFWVPLAPWLHWVFVSYRLVGVGIVLAGVAWAVVGRGGPRTRAA